MGDCPSSCVGVVEIQTKGNISYLNAIRKSRIVIVGVPVRSVGYRVAFPVSLQLPIDAIWQPAESFECFPPSVPMNGTYGDVKRQYTVKEKVQYRCKEGFLLVGDSERTCLSNETWTGKVPFCDKPSPILKTSAEQYYEETNATKIMDKNLRTCLPLGKDAGYGLKVTLGAKSNVKIVRLFVPKGRYDFEVSTESTTTGRESCGTFHDALHKGKWVTMDCSKTATTDVILIRMKGNDTATETREESTKVWTLCEVEAYTLDESECRYPPDDFNIPDAQLVVSRERAMLKCNITKPEKRLYYVCENNKWNKAGEPTCEELKYSKLRNVIIIIVTVVAVSLGVLVIAAYIYRRRKRSVLHQRENELYGLPEMNEYAESAEVYEYADLNYEEIPLPPVPTRKIPVIIPSKMPDLLSEHVTEKHDV